MEQLQTTFDPRYDPCPLLRRDVREGRLGVTTRPSLQAYSEDDAVSNDDEGDKED